MMCVLCVYNNYCAYLYTLTQQGVYIHSRLDTEYSRVYSDRSADAPTTTFLYVDERFRSFTEQHTFNFWFRYKCFYVHWN